MRVNFLGDIGIFKKYEILNIDPFEQIQLPISELNIGNFEFIIPRERNKAYYDVQDDYSCSFEYLKSLQLKKFHGFGFANNHALDYFFEGAIDTIQYLNSLGITTFGFSNNGQYSIGRFEADGVRIGILACVKTDRWNKKYNGLGPNSYCVEIITNLIKENRKNFDHIIVYPHWGTELVCVPNHNDTINAKKFIDAGASVVIGHHPHVPQGVEQYRNRIIAYSLGSFIYIHEDELGYSETDLRRYYSICLNIEFGKNEILDFNCHYYKYNINKKIPEIIEKKAIGELVNFLNNNIYNAKLRKQEIRKILLLREMRSLWVRFKNSPFRTLINYSKLFFLYIRNSVIK